jgi:toxin ParE1/3/4
MTSGGLVGTITRSPQAEEDVLEIGAYIACDSIDAALRWIDTINEKLRLLSEFSGAGTERPELGPGLRTFPVGNYLIVYRPTKDGIEFVRLLHGARNLRRLFRGRRG